MNSSHDRLLGIISGVVESRNRDQISIVSNIGEIIREFRDLNPNIQCNIDTPEICGMLPTIRNNIKGVI